MIIIADVFGADVLRGFTGVMSRRTVPGVHVPVYLQGLFTAYEERVPATRARVSRMHDPDTYYIANVTRVNRGQRIICAPITKKVPDERFPPGTKVVVERIGCREAVASILMNYEPPTTVERQVVVK